MPAEALRRAALAVLRRNDLGGWTKPAPRLYPHQWSWDSAFIAIGLARVDPDRALRELETLFDAQWRDGRVPHIVFNPRAADYFPGAEWWASAATSPQAPRAPATSGLIQPPVHALALLRIYRAYRSALDEQPTPPAPAAGQPAPAGDPSSPAIAAPPHAGGPPSPAAAHQPMGGASREASRQDARGPARSIDARVRALYPRVLAWHRYLATARDPHGTGLLVIYHPWESGTDNSPRWDTALGRVVVGELPAYQRHDLQHVADAAERPTHAEYDRYLWLVESLKKAGYDDRRVQANHPFVVGDVLMSAIFARACQQLAELGQLLARPAAETAELMGYARRFSDGIRRAWHPGLRLALDWDVRAAEPIRVETCAGLAPLLVADLAPALLGQAVERLTGPGFAGASALKFAVVPSTAPGSPGFAARAYWRGPAWPVVNWLLWDGLQQHGQLAPAANLRAANLALLAQPGAQFAEYFEPFTGAPLGSLEQSWTAAVALDWLAAEA